MNRPMTTLAGLAAAALVAGCVPAAVEEPPRPAPPAASRPAERPSAPAAARAEPKVTYDTDRDRPFADFLRDKSGGMIREAAVGIAERGRLQVVLDRSVAPEDTLDLTKALMSGARKDFPDRPIDLTVFDPGGQPILHARYKVGQGVRYEVDHGGEPASASTSAATRPEPRPEAARAPAAARSGPTEADRKFAAWAEEHGKAYLRYVEADLERHGRLWFGVTHEVKPADVPALTKSLLEGARKEFPRGDLTAVVFDPDGGKIGRATLGRDGSVRWDH